MDLSTCYMVFSWRTRDLVNWMQAHEYTSLSQLRGSMSLCNTPNPSAYERGNYMQILQGCEPS